MADLFEVLALMATPVVLLLAMRWHVVRQNRAAESRESQDAHADRGASVH